MRRRTWTLVAIAAGFTLIVFAGNKMEPVHGQARAQGQAPPGTGFAAVPGQKGGQDIFGAYEIVRDWPKLLSALPDHENWTWSCVQSVFAETPNRVFILQRGELPVLPPGPRTALDPSGNRITLPPRNAAQSSPPDNRNLKPGVMSGKEKRPGYFNNVGDPLDPHTQTLGRLQGEQCRARSRVAGLSSVHADPDRRGQAFRRSL